ncbi:hypothetical protein Tco_0044850 [Tanacetum coccineum]
MLKRANRKKIERRHQDFRRKARLRKTSSQKNKKVESENRDTRNSVLEIQECETIQMKKDGDKDDQVEDQDKGSGDNFKTVKLEEIIGKLKTYEERLKFRKGSEEDNSEKLLFTRQENDDKEKSR